MTPHTPEIRHLDPAESKRRIDGGAMLLDVRNADEWEAGHVEGSTWIPMNQIVDRQGEIPTDREIVVICKVGGRSARVAEALVGAGYDAANVAGGAEAWQAAGLPIVTSDGQPGTVA